MAKAAKRAANVHTRICPVPREVWDVMVEAYRNHPSTASVQEAAGVGRRIARRAIQEGWPDSGLPAIVEIISGNKRAPTVMAEMAKLRQEWEDTAVTQGEAARMAAEQAMAARITMDTALRSMRLSQALAIELMTKLESGQVTLPEEVTPRVIKQITASLDASAALVKKAIEIERLRAGEPEAALGIQIGILLERCTEEELSTVAISGQLPSRMLDQRRTVLLQVSEQTAGEAKALGAKADGSEDASSFIAKATGEGLAGLDEEAAVLREATAALAEDESLLAEVADE